MSALNKTLKDLGVDPLVGLHFGAGVEDGGVFRGREELHPGVRLRRLRRHLLPGCGLDEGGADFWARKDE